MTEPIQAGPSAVADCEPASATGVPDPLGVLLLPDAVAPDTSYALLRVPRLGLGTPDPAFSLTLTLDRPPAPNEENIATHLTGGVLAFEVSLAVPEGVRSEIAVAEGRRILPLFARKAQFDLFAEREGREVLLASVPSGGSSLHAALSANLSRAEALDVLSALDGTTSRLRLCAEVTFRAASPHPTVRLRGSWETVHDFLKTWTDDQDELGFLELRTALEEMLESAVVAAFGVSGSGAEEPLFPSDADTLLPGFLRSAMVLLERATPGLPSDDSRNRYRLARRPPQGSRCSYTQAWTGASLRKLSLDTGLERIIGGALDGADRDRFIHLVCPTAGRGHQSLLAPRRLQATPGSRGPQPERVTLSAIGGSVTAVAHAMRPSPTSPRPAALIAADIVRPQLLPSPWVGALAAQWWVDDLVLEHPTAAPLRNLPLVEDPSAPIWRDRADPRQYWYAPAFEVVRPPANASASSSPFLFNFRRVGATGDGRPALAGSVRFTLLKKMSPATRAAVERMGIKNAKALRTPNLSVALAIPYRDENDGRLKRNVLQGRVVQTEDIVNVTVDLLSESVRLSYGALAVPGFQSEPPRLEVLHTFEAYVPIKTDELDVVAGGKVALTPVVHSKEDDLPLGPGLQFDGHSASYRFGAGEVRFEREAQGSPGPPEITRGDERPPGPALVTPGLALPEFRAGAMAGLSSTVVSHPVVVARPPIQASAALAQLIQQTRYATRSLLRQERIDAVFSCEEMGGFYQQETENGAEAIGCLDALRLGQAVVRNYGELTELAHPLYRVFRSLQQPGRFLILPTTYRITRYAPTVPGKAYRPSISVYSSIDPSEPANNRVIYHATLQPDIPPDLRRELQSRLAVQAEDPLVEYPTEISAEGEYYWSVGSTVRVEPTVIKTPDSFQVTLATDLAGALLLRTLVQTSGLFGSARFRLADGATLETNLAVELTAITGPWSTGPVEVGRDGTRALLTNRIERSVDVSHLVVYTAAGARQQVAVETTIPPGASHSVSLPAGASEAYPVFSLLPGTAPVLEEIRSFVEDIHTNVIFINLVNHANHDLIDLEIQAELRGVPGTSRVAMHGDPPRGSVEFLLPLTTYLEGHVLRFRVKKSFNGRPAQTTGWLEWDLETNGNVVGITWELIGAGD